MGLTAVLVIATLFHVAAVASGVFMDNLFDPTGTAYYGGETGPLPGAGSAYESLTSFLAGDDRPALDDPGDVGGFAVFRWILTGPLCISVDITKMFLTVTTFAYPVVMVIPSEGFGLWIKLAIHAVSTLLTLVGVGKLVGFLMRSGVLSNPYALVALGIMGVVGFVSTLANGAGVLGC